MKQYAKDVKDSDQALWDAYTQFVSSLDNWIVLMVKNSKADNFVQSIRSRIAHNIESNIHYYGKLSDEFKSQNDVEGAEMYRRVEMVYSELKK